MASLKKKKKKKGVIADTYDGFSAPTSLLLQRFSAIDDNEEINAQLSAARDHALTQLVVTSPIGRRGARHLAVVIHDVYHTRLRALRCWGARLGDEGAAELVNALVYMPALHHLDLTEVGFGEVAAGALNAALRRRRNRSLEMITLAMNEMSDAAVEMIAKGLMMHKPLRRLDMSFAALTKMAGDHLGMMMRSPMMRIRALNLEGNRLGQEGVVKLVEGMKENKTIEQLNLSNNTISAVDVSAMKAMSDLIVSTPSLSSVDLDGNLLNDDSAAILLTAVLRSPHLRKLIVSSRGSPLLVKMIVDEIEKRQAFAKKRKGTRKARPP